MCGILGGVDVEINDALLGELRHRGPDCQGLEQIAVGKKQVLLGHTRLSILDLSPAGRQPMPSRDGRWWLTFNGEIYNHLDLRKTIQPPFRGHSDTETLVELLALHGIEQTLPQLNGMFSFAALDLLERKIYLARDPFGIKPLYYSSWDGHFAFSSEARGLKRLGRGAALNPAGLKQFLALRYVPSPATLWDGIDRLPPGHLLCLDLGTGEASHKPFITPVTERFSGSLDDAVEVYRERLAVAVKRQLLSDVPVGVLLSGGVDSALVAAMARDAGRELPCFTVGFGAHHAECEIGAAAHTAKILGLPFSAVSVTPDLLKEKLPQIVGSVEEPLGTTSVMPMWELVRRAREDVTVVLTGQGTDEPWGGYFRYQVELLRRRLPWATPWKIARSIGATWHRTPEAVARGLRSLSESDEARQITEACALFSAEERSRLVGDAGDGGAEDRIRSWLLWLGDAGTHGGPERMMRLDARMNLADDLLLYGDKISMAVSLESRVPMLDLELVRFVESLPEEYRIGWRRGKIVHKRMAERYLPSQIVHRPKKGFQVPFGDWSRGIWKSWVETRLLDGLSGLLNTETLELMWRQHLEQRPDRSRQIFSLVMLSLWWEANR